jgi:hypothetical protein
LRTNCCRPGANLTIVRYINALEERVAFLEARLPDHAEDHYDHGLDSVAGSLDLDIENQSSVAVPCGDGSNHDAQVEYGSESREMSDKSSLVDGVAYLSLCASGTTNTNQEPYYVGSSSGATIARVIQSSIFRNSRGRRSTQSVPTQEAQSAETASVPLSAHFDEPQYEFPEFEDAQMLFDVFFERIHTRWPLLDRLVYTKVFEQQYVPGLLTVTERSILHLIYAITARFLSLTRKPCGVNYEVR